MYNFFHKVFFEIEFDHKLARGQAFVRNSIHLIVLMFIYVSQKMEWIGELNDLVAFLGFTYIAYSFCLTLFLIKKPSASKFVSISGMFLDTAILCVLMFTGSYEEISLYGLLLFVTLANGLRFGSTYLIFTNIVSVVGFAIVLSFSVFWQQHLMMGLGLMLWLILLPVYMYALLVRLEKAIENAEGANDAKTQFLANMSHEIRTPLTAIIGFGKTLQSTTTSAEQKKKSIDTIIRNGEHLSGIINDILDISKIEAGKLEVEKAQCSLFDTVDDVAFLFRQRLEDKGLAFSVQYHFPLPECIFSDSLRMKQILINLCSNAEKFTAEGFIKMDVKFEKDTKNILISVSDSGIGMNKSQSEAIFTKFTQADVSTTRKYGGTGLGLSISKKLSQMLDGDLTLESQENIGSCFTLTFSAPEDLTLIESKPVVNAEHMLHETSNIHVKGTVLLVEDVKDNQDLISLLLEEMGVEVDVADNGLIALDKIQNSRFDLIFMDMQMPVMGGIESIKLMREQQYEGPIVILSANVIQNEAEQCRDIGCQGFLGKPINDQELQLTIGQYLEVDSLEVNSLEVDSLEIENLEVDRLEKNSLEKNSLEINNAEKPTEVLEPIKEVEKDSTSDLKHDIMISSFYEKSPKIYNKVVIKFIPHLKSKITEIEMAFQTDDSENLKLLIHNLKGLTGNMGFIQFSDEMQLIENLLADLKNKEAINHQIAVLYQLEEKIIRGKQMIENGDL